MNPVDRFQALIRHPDYRRHASLPSIQHLKLGLDNFLLTRIFESNESSHDEGVKAITLLRTWGLDRTVDPGDEGNIAAVFDALKTHKASIFNHDLRARIVGGQRGKKGCGSGRFLTISVDLQSPTVELLPIVAVLINKERERQEIKTKRTKQHEVDPWKVWDMMQVPGNNLLKITRIIFGVQGNPTYDDDGEMTRSYKKVQRAYRKAESLIKEVGMSRSKPLTEKDADGCHRGRDRQGKCQPVGVAFAFYISTCSFRPFSSRARQNDDKVESLAENQNG